MPEHSDDHDPSEPSSVFAPPPGPPIDPTWGLRNWVQPPELADDGTVLEHSSFRRPDDKALVPIPTVRQYPPRGGYRDFRRAPVPNSLRTMVIVASVTTAAAVVLAAAALML